MLLKTYVKVICHGAFSLQEHCILTFCFTKKYYLLTDSSDHVGTQGDAWFRQQAASTLYCLLTVLQ